MILSPFTKKVEIYVGYKGFYIYGDEKITLTIEEAGVGVLVDTREIFNLNRGSVVKYFKPMANLSEGKKYSCYEAKKIKKELTNQPESIYDTEEFWKELDHYRLFNEADI